MQKAVFEELNGDLAVFIVDDAKRPYHVNVSNLPEDATLGDVFEVEITTDDLLKIGKNLPAERKRREAMNQSKREKLLRRKKK